MKQHAKGNRNHIEPRVYSVNGIAPGNMVPLEFFPNLTMPNSVLLKAMRIHNRPETPAVATDESAFVSSFDFIRIAKPRYGEPKAIYASALAPIGDYQPNISCLVHLFQMRDNIWHVNPYQVITLRQMELGYWKYGEGKPIDGQ